MFPEPAFILVHPEGGNVAPSKSSRKLKGKFVVAVADNGEAVAFKQYVTGVVTIGDGGKGLITTLMVSLRKHWPAIGVGVKI